MTKVHICAEPRCHRVIPFNQKYCDEHIKLHQRFSNTDKEYYKDYNRNKRDQTANKFYHSIAWQKVRAFVVNRDCYTSAVTHQVLCDGDLIVDHVVPRKYCINPLDSTNLWCLSRQEHAIKTMLEQEIASTPNGVNKLKHISRQWWIAQIKKRLNR